MKIKTPANTKTVILNIASSEMIELKKEINGAKTKLGLSNSELSKLIGHSRNYLSECLRVGVSTEKQSKIAVQINKAVEVELIRRGVINPECSMDMSCGQDQSVITEFVSKAYHEQEIRRLKNVADIEKQLKEELIADHENEKNEIIQDVKNAEKYSEDLKSSLEEQTQNVRMLNMEVEQFKVDFKELENDLAIANRDKNFMKKKLQDKNLVINWLVASNVFFILFLVAKCAGWV